MKTTQIDTPVQSDMAMKNGYEKPTVTTFGSVAKLTQGVGGSHADAGHNNNTKRGGH